jgi:hypothetical protein
VSLRHSALLTGALLALAHASGTAQAISVGDPLEDYVRVRHVLGEVVAGSFMVRGPGTRFEFVDARPHPWRDRLGAVAPAALPLSLDPVRLRAFANSRFPVGRNDGAVWQGRGVTTALDFGATGTWRRLTATFHPIVSFTGNARFQLAPVSLPGMPSYAYPWRVIDMPQRFGADPFWIFDWGQSQLRVDAGPVSLGVSTANQWWGPGTHNALVMSDHAPGFPHVFLGTSRPAATAVGSFEARWIWGRLAQSDWFDPGANDRRFLTGIVLAYSPEVLDGLTLGLTRVFYSLVPDGGVPIEDYFSVFVGRRNGQPVTPQNPTGDADHDQLLSIFGRWVFPDDGFEIYGEWARNDDSWRESDFLLEPEHSQAYVFGLQKALRLTGNRLLALRTELTHLERSPTFQVRDTPTYYAHRVVTQGYTHRGQIVGAGVGPGGNAQHIGADLYAPWGRWGIYLEREVHDNDAYYAWAAANDATYCCHDVSFHLAADALFFVGDFDVGGGFIATREFNRNFFGLDLWNLNLSVSARWRGL